MAVHFQLLAGPRPPDLFDLPWWAPLEHWDHPRLVRMARGTSRHVVRFVADQDRVFALKETSEGDARREYEMLGELMGESLPVVQAAGVVSGRVSRDGEMLPAVLVTRYLDYSLPFRYLFDVENSGALGRRLLDAGVVLLARLHLAGFYWGDCSLSNLLFRRDAGALAAYLVDAETTERHPSLSAAMREHDLSIASENMVGGLLDLQAAGRLTDDIDPYSIPELLEQRYHSLWDELTAPDKIGADERHLLDRRIRRINDLGFDVAELSIDHDPTGQVLVIRPAVVEEGHHARELRHLTGLEVQENQARRLLNDIEAFGCHLSRVEGRNSPLAVVAARWIAEVYEPVLASIPSELRGRLEPAELFHELLEHRYYLSERGGREVSNDEALRSYLDTELHHRPTERVLYDET